MTEKAKQSMKCFQSCSLTMNIINQMSDDVGILKFENITVFINGKCDLLGIYQNHTVNWIALFKLDAYISGAVHYHNYHS